MDITDSQPRPSKRSTNRRDARPHRWRSQVFVDKFSTSLSVIGYIIGYYNGIGRIVRLANSCSLRYTDQIHDWLTKRFIVKTDIDSKNICPFAEMRADNHNTAIM